MHRMEYYTIFKINQQLIIYISINLCIHLTYSDSKNMIIFKNIELCCNIISFIYDIYNINDIIVNYIIYNIMI